MLSEVVTSIVGSEFSVIWVLSFCIYDAAMVNHWIKGAMAADDTCISTMASLQTIYSNGKLDNLV